MGKRAVDQFTILHFSVGVLAYFFHIPLWLFIVLHIVFEIVENSKIGMKIINDYIPIWPGGKPGRDSLINSTFDLASAVIGFLVAQSLDKK